MEQKLIVIVALLIWEALWKGIALWVSARKGQKVMFIVILVVNSIGILPIIYLAYIKHLMKNNSIKEENG